MDFAVVQTHFAAAKYAHKAKEPTRARYEFALAWESFQVIVADHVVSEEAIELGWALGLLASDLGNYEHSRLAWEWVLESGATTPFTEVLEFQEAKINLGVALAELGDERGARVLWEEVLEVYATTPPDEASKMHKLKTNLSIVIGSQGDMLTARELLEEVLASIKGTGEAAELARAGAYINLASWNFEMGDAQGADVLFRRALQIFESIGSTESDGVLAAKQGLAVTSFKFGDPARALDLFDEILEVRARNLPEGSRQVLLARNNVAEMLRVLDDLESAKELLDEVVAAFERDYAPGHPDRLLTENSLAQTLVALGELEEAKARFENVMAGFARNGKGELSALALSARASHCRILAALGRNEAANESLAQLAGDLRDWIDIAPLLSPRGALEHADFAFEELSLLLSLCSNSQLGIEAAQQFELVEAFRAASVGSVIKESRLDEDARTSRGRARASRSRVQELAALSQSDANAQDRLRMAVLDRDREEAALRKWLNDAGIAMPKVTAAALAKRLAEDEFAAGYRVYQRTTIEGEPPTSELALLAFVVLDDGEVHRVELGSLVRISEAVESWRNAIGAPITASKMSRSAGEEEERLATKTLRELILDPLLELGAGRKRLHVCLDGPLHLVPLDALLWNRKGAGQVEVNAWVTLGGLLEADATYAGPASFLALGDVNYGEAKSARAVIIEAATPTYQDSPDRGGVDDFEALTSTGTEIEALAELFREVNESEAVVLRGAKAGKREFHEQVAGKRYLHLATHGFIADERVRSWMDSLTREGNNAMCSPLDAALGMAPMSLCGLALAGANVGETAAARLPGMLTAEELAGLSLNSCELAVLSACETHVGIARAGQGLQSLHAALHTAGVRTTVTSLWTVKDDVTRELMIDFYRYMWVGKLPKAEALKEAKRNLWKKRYPTRLWAGWVLIGDPD